MKKSLFLTAAIAMGAAAAWAAPETSPLWLRNTAISPDGKTVAFTYKGDIFTVPVTGGRATQLTSDPGYDTAPVWSPDGKTIAFSSNRMGSPDIWTVSAEGGAPVRITTHSGNETPLAFDNNGNIIFDGYIQPSKEALNGYIFGQIYTVPATGGRPRLLESLPAQALSVDRQGRILYQDKKGYEDKLRKHERSSVTGDIWLLTDAGTGREQFRKLTDFNGHDINPQWTDEDDMFMYVSEKDGTLNVYCRNLDGTVEKQLTRFDRHPVRSLSVAGNGTAAFSQNGEIYVMEKGAQPRRLDVTIAADNGDEGPVKVSRRNATDIAVSPDGKEIALIVRGDVYVTSADYATTRQITSTPGQERHVEFTADGKTLVYDSERDGLWQIYKSTIKDPKEKHFTYASDIEETRLTDSDKVSFTPRVSPDGKKVAYLEDRTTLKVIDIDGKNDHVAMSGENAYSYVDGDVGMEWNPTSDWLLFNGYIGKSGWNHDDVAAVKADGSQLINLTQSGYSNGNAKFTRDGKGVLYVSDRNGYRSHGSWGSESDVYVMWLDQQAANDFIASKADAEFNKETTPAKEDTKEKATAKEGKKKGKKGADAKKPAVADYKFEGRENRVYRLTPNSSNLVDYYLDNKGDKLYYLTSFEDDADLWEYDLKDRVPRIVEKKFGYGALLPDSAGTKLYSIIDGSIKTYDIEKGKTGNISFNANGEYSASAERKYMLDHCKRLVKEKFYDKNLHGVDWEGYTADYARFLPYIDNDRDFAELLSELLGELNASHTGGRASTGSAKALDATAYLGAFYDEAYTGDGLKVAEVIERGPLARLAPSVKSGDVITAIDGKEVKAGTDYFPLLAGKSGQNIRLTVRHADGTITTEKVKPVSNGANRLLLYERWKDRNRHIVDSISGGKVGYVHITGMDSPSFREIYSDVMGKYRDCDAIVIDTRFNGGGWLHNDVAQLFSGRKTADFAPQGHYIGSDPINQFTKPSAMLVSECNYSDAYGTPYTYKTLNVGKLVGAPVAGTMTAVWWETQVNPNIIFGIPQVTCLDLNGKPLENQQLNPDLLIYNQPADILNGKDSQLEGAVRLLMGN